MQPFKRHTRNNRLGGFTLLEVVFVLAMIAILVTWLTVSLSTVETEQKLREASGRIELLAKRGLNIAVQQQRPYQLTIGAQSVSLAPRYSYGEKEEDYMVLGDEDGAAQLNMEDIVASETMDGDVSYEIKRWRSDDWQLLEGDKKMVLMLNPIGLVEPISIRCSMGESWLQHELHPLTAGFRGEEMSIVKE